MAPMLTGPQTSLHWRTWSRVVDANDWVMQTARLSKDAQRTAGLSIYHKLVWQAAERLALQQHRAVTADDLRHACYLTATTKVPSPEPGVYLNWKPVSSMKDLGNREFSRFLVLCDLLIYPDDILATVKWENPHVSEAEGLDKTIAKMAHDAYVREIASRACGTRMWEGNGTTIDQKRNLRRILSERRKNWNQDQSRAKPTKAAKEINQPF